MRSSRHEGCLRWVAAATIALALPGCILDRAGRLPPRRDAAPPRVDAGRGPDAGRDAGAACVPEPERCDGLDQDCDERIDEEIALTTCDTACGTGDAECVAGEWVCDAIAPAEERCNALDDDCDERIDEMLVRGCSTDCGPGTQRCSGGRWLDCEFSMSRDETCDGTDEDCDLSIDEGVTRPCTGSCGGGIETCAAGVFGVCSGDMAPESCNGHDDDCDATIDEASDCTCALVRDAGGAPWLFCDGGTDWAAAQAFCEARGYDLATVPDADTNAFVAATALGRVDGEWWIGLNDRATEDSFRWASGSAASFRNFHASQPNSSLGDQDCVSLDNGDQVWEGRGQWGDRDCLAVYPFVCSLAP